ncbi:MAG: VCBS repeat-containing protein [Candidatus Eisenbacteria bacterium]
MQRTATLAAIALLVGLPAIGAPAGKAPASQLKPGPWGSGWNPSDAAIADIDGDGNADLVVSYASTGRVNICLGDGTGSFGDAAEIETDPGVRAVAVGFRGGERVPFIAVLNRRTESVSFHLRDEEGRFVPLPTTLPAGKSPVAIAVGYSDADRLDPFVVVANQGSNDLSLYLPDESGGFAARTVDLKRKGQPDPSPSSVATGDFDSDGLMDDLVVTNKKYQTLTLLFGRERGEFERRYKDVLVREGPEDVAACSVGKPGEPLLVVANRLDREATIYARADESVFGLREAGLVRARGGLVSVSLAEVGTMGTALLAVASRVRGEVFVFLVEPGGETTEVGVFPADPDIRSVAAGCLSGADKPFVLAAGRGLYPIPLFDR